MSLETKALPARAEIQSLLDNNKLYGAIVVASDVDEDGKENKTFYEAHVDTSQGQLNVLFVEFHLTWKLDRWLLSWRWS